MRVTFQICAYFYELFYKSNTALFPCLQSLILTLGGLGEFSQPSSCLDETIRKHGKSALLLKQNIFGNPSNSAKKRLVTSRKIEPKFSNIFGNLTRKDPGNEVDHFGKSSNVYCFRVVYHGISHETLVFS